MKFRFRHFFYAAAVILAAACNEERANPDKSDKTDNKEDNTENVIKENPTLPRPQLRAAWMATVWGLDWPDGKYDEASQKALYTEYLDSFKKLGINAIFFQVRGMADAYYESAYEPWSRTITGTAGKHPGYDIMDFLISETHKRGMEFHAWINPYRVSTPSYFQEGLDKKIPESMVIKYDKIWVYNPALPEVRQRIADIVKEIVTKYNVDGIHMDDYFYQTSSLPLNDESDYKKYGSGYNSIEDFRRGNIFEMVKLVKSTLLANKPEVAFTIGPQGNYDNNYKSQYIDMPKVCAAKLIDAVIPQLYWSTKASKDYYTPRLDWWSQNVSGIPMMVGHSLSGFKENKAGYESSSELETQFSLADRKSNSHGHVLYSAKTIKSNPKSIQSVISKSFSTKALLPHLGGTGADVAPEKPKNIVLSGNTLNWDEVKNAKYYAVYKSNGDKRIATLIETVDGLSFQLTEKGKYFVTALDSNNLQSAISDIVEYK